MRDSGMYPRALADRPTLDERQLFYYEVFNELSAGRSYGMAGPLPISIDAIGGYCEFYGINDFEQRTQIAKFARILDNAYLDDAFKKSEDVKT